MPSRKTGSKLPPAVLRRLREENRLPHRLTRAQRADARARLQRLEAERVARRGPIPF